MGALKYLDHTYASRQAIATGSNGSGKVFLERAHLVGTGISTLTIYDGGGTGGRLVAILACLANDNDDCVINEICPNGVYVVMTTGAGLAKAVLYDR